MENSSLGMIYIGKGTDDSSIKWESIKIDEYRTKKMLKQLRFYKQECVKITQKIRDLSKKLDIKVDLTNFKLIK